MRWLALILSIGIAAESHAGIYADDMARCLVRSTSDADKTALVRWVFAIASLHPGVADIAKMSPAMRESSDRTIAALFERLITQDCQSEAREAIRYEGPASFEQSFQVLGEVAMNELMVHPDVGGGFAAFMQYLDQSKFEVLRQ